MKENEKKLIAVNVKIDQSKIWLRRGGQWVARLTGV